MALDRVPQRVLLRRRSHQHSTMRLFTVFAGSQRVLTLNATDEQEGEGRTHHARRDGRRRSDHPARNA
jgi:hypothetical protein